MGSLDKFPGLLGYDGIIAIHADWPTYPPGIGWEIALRSLANFPEGTKLYQISDIDRCKLLIDQNPSSLKDPFDYRYYHVAAWHEDLAELFNRGMITGIELESEYEFKIRRFNELKTELGDAAEEDQNGNLVLSCMIDNKSSKLTYDRPQKDLFDEGEFVHREYVHIPEFITLTKQGFEALKIIDFSGTLHKEIESIVSPLIMIGKYDSAVREVSLFLETQIKVFHKTNLFGQKLIAHHINAMIGNNDNYNSAALKNYNGELRTVFKFIRNDFAHNFRILTEVQCKIILYRISLVYAEFLEVINVYRKK